MMLPTYSTYPFGRSPSRHRRLLGKKKEKTATSRPSSFTTYTLYTVLFLPCLNIYFCIRQLLGFRII